MLTTRLMWCTLPTALVLICVGASTGEDKPPPRTLRVQVLGPGDKPLKGADIHVSTWPIDPSRSNKDFVCDDEGRLELALPERLQTLRVWASFVGHVGLFANWEDISKTPGEFTFKLEKGTVIGGTVTNDDGEPIEGVKVEVMLVHEEEEDKRPVPNTWLATEDKAVKTDAKGRWSIDNVPAGDAVQVRVCLSHPKYVSETRWGTLQEEQGVTMDKFRDKTATLAMHNGVPFSGIVVDPVGKPVPGALIVWGDRPYYMLGSQEVFTDADGRFRFPPLAIGLIKVTAVVPGFSPQQESVQLAAQAAIKFELQRGKKLRIHFVDHDGRPVPDVNVLITKWRKNEGLFNIKHSNVVDSKIPRQSDKNGVYEWNWAPDDDVEYSFYKEGYMWLGKQSITADDTVHVVKMIK